MSLRWARNIDGVRPEICAEFWWGNLLKTGGRIRKKWQDNIVRMWIGLIWHRVGFTYEHGIKSFCSMARRDRFLGDRSGNKCFNLYLLFKGTNY
jgi:hypothetical protein